jgi:hypothetical protein
VTLEISGRDFWSWFVHHADALRATHVEDNIIQKLNHKIRSLGIPAWELGPDPKGMPGSVYLCLSDNGDKEKTKTVTDVLSLAPVKDGWRFTNLRQRKEWDGVFEFSSGDEIVRVDCTKWLFGFSKTEQGVLLDICISDTKLKNPEKAAYIFILQEIGEEDFRTHFIDYDLERWSECDKNPLFMSFKEFRNHWNAVLAGTHLH